MKMRRQSDITYLALFTALYLISMLLPYLAWKAAEIDGLQIAHACILFVSGIVFAISIYFGIKAVFK